MLSHWGVLAGLASKKPPLTMLQFYIIIIELFFHKSTLISKRTRKAGVLALIAMALGLLVTNFTIKPLVERPRPWLDWPIAPLVVEDDPNSFPSGHTCAAFAAAMIWSFIGTFISSRGPISPL